MIAHLDLDSFFVAVERARNPDLVNRPVVIGGRRGSQGFVAAASREARRAGIRPGMPLVEAALLSADAVFLEGDLDGYLAASAQVDEVCRRETPEIEWISIDEAFLALPENARRRGTIEAVERIQHELHAMGLDAACGLARSRIVARIASRLAHPHGLVHVLPGYEARFLAPLKIEMMPEIDARVAQRLRSAGIRRLGQLARLSEAQVSLLVGPARARLPRYAAGIDSTPVRRCALPRGPIRDHELPATTTDPTALAAGLRAEVGRLGRDLRGHGVFARSLTVRLRYADGHSESRTASLPEPVSVDEALLAAALEIVSRIDHPLRPVRAIGVSASGLLTSRGAPALFLRS